MSAPRFGAGQHVTVRALGKTGHVRIPAYIRRRRGVVVQYCGAFLNPEELAIGVTSGPVVDLYRVEFRQSDLWPDGGHAPDDRLVIEIYEHWLEAA